MIKACIFDLGGTIVDRYSLTPLLSLKKLFQKREIHLNNDLIFKDMGKNKKDHINLILNDDLILKQWFKTYNEYPSDKDVNALFDYFNTIQMKYSDEMVDVLPETKSCIGYLDFNYKLLEDKGLLELVSDNSEILDGVSTYTVDGHTTGQQLIKISDGDKVVVFCSDLIPLKSHLKLPWIMGYDLNAALTLKEKKEFLDKACEFNWLLFFYHDPKCVAVRIEKGDKYYEVTDEYKR